MCDFEDDLRLYFGLGFPYKDILECLAKLNGVVISISTLKRHLRRIGLFRRKHHSDLTDIAVFIMDKLQGSAQNHGYKVMHLECLHKGFVVSQETVRILLLILDPDGVKLRSRRRLRRRLYRNLGPNYLWHMDSYDKLKPYGICINGAIDGFSRQIIWLKADKTNSNPRLIAGYYMSAVKSLKGVPFRLRADLGTENSCVSQLQTFLRSYNADVYANRSYITGSSKHNQRIEQWWGFLRKENAQYWMNMFGALRDMGQFDGGFLDKGLVQFCFMNFIQVSHHYVLRQKVAKCLAYNQINLCRCTSWVRICTPMYSYETFYISTHQINHIVSKFQYQCYRNLLFIS